MSVILDKNIGEHQMNTRQIDMEAQHKWVNMNMDGKVDK